METRSITQHSLYKFDVAATRINHYNQNNQRIKMAAASDMNLKKSGTNLDTTQLLLKAIDFAAIKHKDQRRKDPNKTPYINHPIGVAQIISKEANISDIDILIGAVLHDTVEDTETTLDEIEEVFGSKIRIIVDEVSDDKLKSKEERKQAQIDKSPFVSYEAKIVKLADKLYNLRDLERQTPEGWTEARVQEYFVWASKVCSSIRGVCKPLDKKLDELFTNRDIVL